VRSRSTCRSVCLNVSGDEKVVDTLDLGHCGGCRQLLLQELLVDQDGRVATWRKAKKKREKMRFVLWGRKERKAPLGEFEHGPCSLFLVPDMQGLLQLSNLLKERLNVLLRIGTLSDAGQGAAVVCECALAARTGPGPGAGAGAGTEIRSRKRGGMEAAWDKMSNPAEVETGPFACAFGCALPLPLPLTFVGCLPASRESSCSSSSSSPKSMQGKRVCQAQTKQETNHKTNTCQLCHC